MTVDHAPLREPTKLRASSLRDCPRRAVLEATSEPDRDRSDREQRFLFRGKSVGRDYVTFLAHANGWKILVESGPTFWVPPELRAHNTADAQIVAEKLIPWAHGIGHADAYLTETRTIVECLSSANPSEPLVRSKLLQCVLYIENDPEAENGAVVILDPSDFTEERIVLSPRSKAYAEFVDEIASRTAQIDEWKRSDVLPARVCSKPSDARQHFCLHADTCFAGWEPPPLETLAADQELLDALTMFYAAKRDRASLAREDRALEATQKDAQTVIEASAVPAGDPVRVGPFEVRRTDVQRSPSFDWKRAELAGAFEPGMFGEFFKDGARYSTFKVERVDVSGDEFGDEAPF